MFKLNSLRSAENVAAQTFTAGFRNQTFEKGNPWNAVECWSKWQWPISTDHVVIVFKLATIQPHRLSTKYLQGRSGSFIAARALLGIFAHVCRQRPTIHCMAEVTERSSGSTTPLNILQVTIYQNIG